MSDRKLSRAEIAAFIAACENNGVKITQKPQSRMKSASIMVGKRTVSFSKNLSAGKRTSEKVK